jgi:8-oxo-dGTP pyrophosphatase MutT (NUDIX family)
MTGSAAPSAAATGNGTTSQQFLLCPKGKLHPGETEAQAGLREVQEETGLRCRLGVGIAALLDIGHWAASATQRNQLPDRRTTAA